MFEYFAAGLRLFHSKIVEGQILLKFEITNWLGKKHENTNNGFVFKNSLLSCSVKIGSICVGCYGDLVRWREMWNSFQEEFHRGLLLLFIPLLLLLFFMINKSFECTKYRPYPISK